MSAKKKYIVPSVDVVMVVQESPLLDFSKTTAEDNTGGSGCGQPEIGTFARYQRFSLWDEEEKQGSLWDD